MDVKGDMTDVDTLDFVAHQRIDWQYIYGLGHIPDEGSSAFGDLMVHDFTVSQGFAGGHSVEFAFSGTGFKYLGKIPYSGTIKHLQILVDGHDAYDFSHFKLGIVSAFKLFAKPQTAMVKALFSGNNWVTGSEFSDTLSGFKGDDRFIFKFAPAATTADIITDFKHNHDVIYLENPFYSVLGDHGHLKASMFLDGTEALKPKQHILYNPPTGELKFDPDGNGPQSPIPIATLSNHPAHFGAHDILLG